MAAEKSKFDGLRGRTNAGSQAPASVSAGANGAKAKIPKSRRTGRPPGKRSNPAYTQVSMHLKRETYYAAQSRLNGEKAEGSVNGDLADIVDSLLEFYYEHGLPQQYLEE